MVGGSLRTAVEVRELLRLRLCEGGQARNSSPTKLLAVGVVVRPCTLSWQC
jgi:hypothetical protein